MPKVISLSSSSQHAMLLYDNNSNRDIASINYINQGLEQKLLCIYASVNTYNTSHLTKISSQIKDYEENVRKRNLLIVNLKPFYDSALAIDLSTRVLVAEPEPDLQQIYNIWLHSMGFKEVVITDSGKECLDEIPTIIAVNKSVNKNKNQAHDLIILDTQLKDIPYVQVAKE